MKMYRTTRMNHFRPSGLIGIVLASFF